MFCNLWLELLQWSLNSIIYKCWLQCLHITKSVFFINTSSLPPRGSEPPHAVGLLWYTIIIVCSSHTHNYSYTLTKFYSKMWRQWSMKRQFHLLMVFCLVTCILRICCYCYSDSMQVCKSYVLSITQYHSIFICHYTTIVPSPSLLFLVSFPLCFDLLCLWLQHCYYLSLYGTFFLFFPLYFFTSTEYMYLGFVCVRDWFSDGAGISCKHCCSHY